MNHTTFSVVHLSRPQTCYDPIHTGSPGWIVPDSTPYSLPYACGLKDDHVFLSSTLVQFTIDSAGCPGSCSGLPFACGEIAATQTSRHGFYNCTLKHSGVAGTVSTCMVASPTRAPYEEIHFKFFGNDTTHISLGYYANGVAYQAGPIELKFAADAEFHDYAFEWSSTYIKWYVDGKEVSSEMGSRPIPTTPNRFVVNFLAEVDGVTTDDSAIFTSNVDRNFIAASAVSSFTNISFTPAPLESCNIDDIVPGNTNWTGYDPTACSYGPVSLVYDDSLLSEWSDSDSTTHSLQATQYVHSGAYAISWDVIPGGRLYFCYSGTIDTESYYGFEFWVYGGGKDVIDITAKLLLPDGITSDPVSIGSVLSSGIQAWQWRRAVFPFDKFGLGGNTAIVGILLSSVATDFISTIYIDGLKFGQKYGMCANSSLMIYSDGLLNNFLDWSWGSYDLTSSKLVYEGQTAVSIELYNNDGVKFHTNSPVDTNKWQGVSMYLNYRNLQGWQINIAVTSGDSPRGTMGLIDYYGGSFPHGDWVRVAIPFSDFGITPGTPVDGVQIVCNTNQYQGVLTLDEISFVSSLDPSETSSANFSTVCTLFILAQIILTLCIL